MQMNVNKDPQKATQKCAWLEKKNYKNGDGAYGKYAFH